MDSGQARCTASESAPDRSLGQTLECCEESGSAKTCGLKIFPSRLIPEPRPLWVFPPNESTGASLLRDARLQEKAIGSYDDVLVGGRRPSGRRMMMRRAGMSTASIQARTKGMRMGSAPAWPSTESKGAASCRRVRPSGVVMNSTPVTVPTGRGGAKEPEAAESHKVHPVKSPTKKAPGSSGGRSLPSMSRVRPAKASAAEIEPHPESLRTIRPAFFPEGNQWSSMRRGAVPGNGREASTAARKTSRWAVKIPGRSLSGSARTSPRRPCGRSRRAMGNQGASERLPGIDNPQELAAQQRVGQEATQSIAYLLLASSRAGCTSNRHALGDFWALLRHVSNQTLGRDGAKVPHSEPLLGLDLGRLASTEQEGAARWKRDRKLGSKEVDAAWGDPSLDD